MERQMEYVNFGENIEDVLIKLDKDYGNLPKGELVSFRTLLYDYCNMYEMQKMNDETIKELNNKIIEMEK